jgi:triosephosphate isomerase
MSKRKPVIIGNWKMNKTPAEAVELANGVKAAFGGIKDVEAGIAPTYLALADVAKRIAGSGLILAAQNCATEDSGAYTGEISVPMLKSIGVTHVIVGHSERRQYYGETDASVNTKAKKVLEHGLAPVICIGETLAEREAERTFEVVERQLRGALEGIDAANADIIVLAYEPVWAIGTGKTASTAQAQEVHGFLRELLAKIWSTEAAEKIRIQYGGSVKPNNITGLMAQPDVDGALVGGASLDVESFAALLKYERQ